MKKKLIVISLMIFTLSSIYAQRAGLKAGFNLAHSKYNLEGWGIISSNLPAFQIGLTGEYAFSEALYINPALGYSRKGVKLSLDGNQADFSIDYLELPVNLSYKYDLGQARVFAIAGPYIAYGLSGRVKSNTDSENLKFGSDDDELGRFDYGIDFGVGLEFDHFNFTVAYSLGLPDISNHEMELQRNGVLSFTIGYFIDL